LSAATPDGASLNHVRNLRWNPDASLSDFVFRDIASASLHVLVGRYRLPDIERQPFVSPPPVLGVRRLNSKYARGHSGGI